MTHIEHIGSLVDQFGDDMDRAAWQQIAAKLVEGQKPSTNTGSPKLPTLEQLWNMMIETGEISSLGLEMNTNAQVVKLAYDCMCRQLRAGA